VVLPKAGGRQAVPTVELGDGTVIRDGAAIIDHFEVTSGHAFSPKSPKQRILSRLFDVIGSDGLLRPALHYLPK
jgi:glutathione S-transferase